MKRRSGHYRSRGEGFGFDLMAFADLLKLQDEVTAVAHTGDVDAKLLVALRDEIDKRRTAGSKERMKLKLGGAMADVSARMTDGQ